MTAVAPVRFVPEIVTLVPPALGPDEGAIPDTVGAGGPPPPWYGLDVTGVASDVVWAISVEAVETLGGFVSPSSSTVI